MIKFNSKCFLKCFFFHKKASLESNTSMRDPCNEREQSLGTHDIVNDQGFANTVSRLEVS